MRFGLSSIFAKSIFAAAALCAASTASAAVQFTLPLSGSSNVSGDGVARTYSLSDAFGNTLNVKVTAWSIAVGSNANLTNSSIVTNGRVGRYSTGLGVTNDQEVSGAVTNSHTIDNYLGRDFLIFQFDKAVELVSGDFTPYKLGSNTYWDLDYSLGAGLHNFANTPSLNGANYGQLKTMFGNTITNFSDSASSGATQTNALNQLNRAGNIWLVGASFGDSQSKFDAFKFNTLVVKVPVPEPATWMMMIAGFGLIGGSIRRQRKHQTALSAA